MSERRWRVGELAKATGLTVRTLHHYENVGLFGPAGRTSSDHRLYDEAGIEKLYRIRALRGLGMSLDEIRKSIDDPTMLADLLRTQLTRVETEVERLSQLGDRLRSVLTSDADIGADALLLTLDAMTRVERHVYTRRRHEPGPESRWRALGEQLRVCMDAGDDPSSKNVQAVATQVQRQIRAFAGGDPRVEEALGCLRRLSPPRDFAGWDAGLMRYLDRAFVRLGARVERGDAAVE